ncbi:MAG TPA: lipoyl(octanoyl) transferase LipB [Alkalispirochaeta sp.]|nr:lipoyl(octanoyl) transferase LipB [Alkalispirochaeta sp.]
MKGTLGRNHPLTIRDLGSMDYRAALNLQHTLVAQRQRGEISDTLLLVEHPPVITMGKSGVMEHVLVSPEVLSAAGATVERIERGGEATYHGPGQLVGYPILDLRAHLRSLKTFVNLLEEVFVRYLDQEFSIAAHRDDEHRGVWVNNEKITAVGIAVQQRVTFHGFAFNVNTDLSHFDWIIPCGITDRGQTSLERLTGTPQDMSSVKEGISRTFTELFGYRWTGINSTG